RDIRSGINRNNNNAMDNIDNQFKTMGTVGQAPVTQIASKTKSVLDQASTLKGRLVGSGQCYALSAWYANALNGPGLGGGVTSLRGLIGGGMAASQIGTDYNWGQFGWKSIIPRSVADLIPGAIANIKANAGGPVYTSGWGHTVVIKAISGDTLTVLEQNFAGHQYVEERNYSASAYLGVVQTVCYPPEIVQGKRINGTTEPTPDSTTDTSTTSEEKTITISNALYREWKNDKGDVEFYVKNGMLYAPISKDLYPSAFSGRETDDNWIRKDIEVQTDAEEVLISTALATLRKNAYPAITYEVVGYVANLDVGDTVKISDKEYSPSLTLEARVSEQHISFTEPNQNKTVFDNYKALENKTSSILIDRMNDMAEQAKPYDLRLITDNGTTFKNSTGRSVLTAELWKSNKKFNATFQFRNFDTLLASGLTYTVDGSTVPIEKPFLVSVDAFIGNDLVATRQITFTNTGDGVSPILMVIKSSNGNIFKNNIISTRLIATLWRDNKEIDIAGNDFAYVWTKKNADGTLDKTWNAQHQTSQKSITITQFDIWQRATFDCDVTPI
ncbi:phage tail protein, partial [Streptococcus iniae]